MLIPGSNMRQHEAATLHCTRLCRVDSIPSLQTGHELSIWTCLVCNIVLVGRQPEAALHTKLTAFGGDLAFQTVFQKPVLVLVFQAPFISCISLYADLTEYMPEFSSFQQNMSVFNSDLTLVLSIHYWSRLLKLSLIVSIFHSLVPGRNKEATL